MTPEQQARQEIDRQLAQCGWVVQDFRRLNISAGPGIAVREFPLSTGSADYLLYVDGRACGVVEAIFYAQGVKANVLFFDAKPGQEKPWTTKLWVYDLRTNMHFTQKTNPLQRADLDDFVQCYRPGKRHLRKPTWDADKTPDGRWRVFGYDELIKRDKVNLDIFWLKDQSLEDSDDLPAPDILAQEIADDLQTALEQFQGIAEKLKG